LAESFMADYEYRLLAQSMNIEDVTQASLEKELPVQPATFQTGEWEIVSHDVLPIAGGIVLSYLARRPVTRS
jgi:hypothetical protein